MSDTIDSLSEVMPSAAPTDEEIAAWMALPRDEQARRMRLALTHPDCDKISPRGMSEILELAHARSDARNRG